jgi:prolyl oligopeptidase
MADMAEPPIPFRAVPVRRTLPVLLASLAIACGSAPPAAPAAPRTKPPSPIAAAAAPVPPPPASVEACETRFGIRICDADRWLEAPTTDPAVHAWLVAHDTATRKRIAGDAFAEALEKRVDAIWKTSKWSDLAPPPVKKPDAKAARTLRAGGIGIELVSGDKTVGVFPKPAPPSRFGESDLSKSGELALVERITNGHDLREYLVRDMTATGDAFDVLSGIEASASIWDDKRRGLYYVFTPEGPHAPRFGEREIRFHRVGTAQATDLVVVPASHDKNESSGKNPLGLVGGRWLLARTRSSWDRSDRFATIDMAATPPKPRELVQPDGVVEDARPGETSLLVTVVRQDRSRSIRRAPASGEGAWSTLREVPRDAHFTGAKEVKGWLVLEFGAGHSQRFEICDPQGKKRMEWTAASGSLETVKVREGELVVHTTGLMGHGELARLDPEHNTRVPFRRSAGTWDGAAYDLDAIEAETSDGTKIPMEVLRKKGVPLDGKAPLWVFGYGGFQYSQFLPFQALVAAWVEAGGIYAVTHLRGGEEWGRDWSMAALRTTHFRSVTDFARSVETLHQRGYGSPKTTMIHGRSHGGLIASRVGIGWPLLATLVLAEVPLADMVHFAERGRGGVTEYGDPDDPGELPALIELSAVHAVRAGTKYPTFFVTTAVSDERVDPMHPAKLTSALERAGADVLLKVDWTGGHLGGGGEPWERSMAQALGRLHVLASSP